MVVDSQSRTSVPNYTKVVLCTLGEVIKTENINSASNPHHYTVWQPNTHILLLLISTFADGESLQYNSFFFFHFK